MTTPAEPRTAPAAGPPGGHERSAQLRAWLDAVGEFTRAVNRGMPSQDLLNLIAGTVAHLTGYDFCGVLLPDDDGERLLIRGSYGLLASYVAEVNVSQAPLIRPGASAEGPSSRAFRSQRPVILVDICADPACGQWESLAEQQGYRAILSLPLVASEGSLGVLNCYHPTPREWVAHEVVLMETIANQAALAIESTRLRERERTRSRELARQLEALEHEHRIVGRGEEVYRDLMRVLLAGEGLERITRQLAGALRSDVLVEDPAGHPLAAAVSAQGLERMPPAEARQDPGVEERLAQAAAEHRVVEVGGGDRPASLVAPLVLDDELAGRLWAFNPKRGFGAFERQALDRGALVAALAVSRQRTAQEVEWRLSAEFLDDLLSADVRSDDLPTLTRARQLGLDLSAPHAVVVVRPDPTGDDAVVRMAGSTARLHRSLLTQVQRAVNEADPSGGALVAARGDNVIVLWPERDGAPRAAELAERLGRHCRAYSKGTVSVGLGPPCQDAGDYADAYRLADSALDLTQRAGSRDRVVALEELGVYRVLLQVKRPEELVELVRSVLGPLHDYDARHDTALVETLRSFLRCRFSTAATAEALIVHPNTIGYRLRRIQELLGVDCHDPQTLLHFQLAFMIEGVLAGRTEGNGASAT